jgi:hypothetical protein
MLAKKREKWAVAFLTQSYSYSWQNKEVYSFPGLFQSFFIYESTRNFFCFSNSHILQACVSKAAELYIICEREDE